MKLLMKKKQLLVSNGRSNYIFSYGSLMDFNTRVAIAPNALVVFPAKIKGYIRGWFVRQASSNKSYTYLGTVSTSKVKVKVDNDTVNGVLYKVTPQELIATDFFEREGYKRVLIPISKVSMLCGESLPTNGNIWMYIANLDSMHAVYKLTPSKNYPIIKTYLETCLLGCMQIENAYPRLNGFLKTFIDSTLFWNNHIVDDRPVKDQSSSVGADAFVY